MMTITVRPAKREELERVNELRKIVNDVHVNGRPDIFRAEFCDELKAHIYEKFDSQDSDVFAAVTDGMICGFAVVDYVHKPQSLYSNAQSYYNVVEFGVDEKYRRQGVATKLIEFMKADAAEKGFDRIELDMWEFNEGARLFYESAGFTTYRRYMELDLK